MPSAWADGGFRQFHGGDAGTGRLQLRESAAHPFFHARRAVAPEMVPAEPEPEVGRPHRVERANQRRAIAIWIDGREGMGRVRHRSRERPRAVEAGRGGHNAFDRPAPGGGLEADGAGGRRRHAHRAARIAAQRHIGRALEDAHPSTTRGAARQAVMLRVPGIARRPPVGVDAEAVMGELDRVGLAHEHRQLPPQGAHDRPLGLEPRRQALGRAGEDRHAADAEEVP